MLRLTRLAPLLALLGGLATAAGGEAAPSGPLLIEDVTIVDVERGRIRPGASILVRDGRIARVGAPIRAPRGARRVDGRGKFAIPGLWDMHAHHQAVGEGSPPLFVANGVLGTRDMGADTGFIFPLRDRIRSGALLGPEIVAAGPILDAAPADWPLRRRVADAGQARAAVRDLAARGADFIKVHDQTPRDAYFAIARESRRLGIPFAGHVPTGVTAEEAVAAGQKSIEHLSNFQLYRQCSAGGAYQPRHCEPFFRRMAAARVWQTPTLVFLRALPDLLSGAPVAHAEYASVELERFDRRNQEAAKLPPEAVAWIRGQGETALAAVGDMKAAGVPFLAGCDAMVPGFCLHDELEWLVRAGFTPAEALRAATIDPARFLGRQASEGTIAPGKTARLVLLDADPLADIRNTRRIYAVVLRGRLLTRAELAGLLAAARRRPQRP